MYLGCCNCVSSALYQADVCVSNGCCLRETCHLLPYAIALLNQCQHPVSSPVNSSNDAQATRMAPRFTLPVPCTAPPGPRWRRLHSHAIFARKSAVSCTPKYLRAHDFVRSSPLIGCWNSQMCLFPVIGPIYRRLPVWESERFMLGTRILRVSRGHLASLNWEVISSWDRLLRSLILKV